MTLSLVVEFQSLFISENCLSVAFNINDSLTEIQIRRLKHFPSKLCRHTCTLLSTVLLIANTYLGPIFARRQVVQIFFGPAFCTLRQWSNPFLKLKLEGRMCTATDFQQALIYCSSVVLKQTLLAPLLPGTLIPGSTHTTVPLVSPMHHPYASHTTQGSVHRNSSRHKPVHK